MPARQVQWGVRLVWSDGLVMDEPSGMGEEYARAFVRQINEREPRPDDPTPRATSAVLTRRTVTYGDWEEVEA